MSKVQIYFDEKDQASYKQKAQKIIQWLQEKKAREIICLDLIKYRVLTEAAIILSAANKRHAQTLSDWLLEKLKENKMEFLGIEGYENGTWILIDCNEVVIHVFQQDYRTLYNLEGLWREAPRFYEQNKQDESGLDPAMKSTKE